MKRRTTIKLTQRPYATQATDYVAIGVDRWERKYYIVWNTLGKYLSKIDGANILVDDITEVCDWSHPFEIYREEIYEPTRFSKGKEVNICDCIIVDADGNRLTE